MSCHLEQVFILAAVVLAIAAAESVYQTAEPTTYTKTYEYVSCFFLSLKFQCKFFIYKNIHKAYMPINIGDV